MFNPGGAFWNECPQTIFPLWVLISKRIWESKGMAIPLARGHPIGAGSALLAYGYKGDTLPWQYVFLALWPCGYAAGQNHFEAVQRFWRKDHCRRLRRPQDGIPGRPHSGCRCHFERGAWLYADRHIRAQEPGIPRSVIRIRRTPMPRHELSGLLRQHRTMGAAGFGGSFAPIVQHEKWEIRPVFPHFPYFRSGQNTGRISLPHYAVQP